ncbi:DnaJ domain-containing protein [Mrakia frigida]|uniref:DnaJ domain-containing protein n=1 Tax=Mrakia frigida TaxID=29902 RepID=UPI003FCC0A7B
MSFYDILGVSKDASQREIKNAWRELVLKHHPDKAGTTETTSLKGGEGEVDIHLLTSAYEVLRSDLKREIYDRELLDSTRNVTSNSSLFTTPTIPPPLARTTFSLSDFTPHYGPKPPVFTSAAPTPAEEPESERKEEEEDDDPTYYTHPCRCGFELLISREELEEGVDVIGCDGCGDWIGVGYEVLEESEEEEGEE